MKLKTNLALLVFALSSVSSISSFANEKELNTNVSKKFSHSMSYFSVKAKAKTTVTITDINKGPKSSFNLKVTVKCSEIDAKQGLSADENQQAPWKISETFCVNTTGNSIPVTFDSLEGHDEELRAVIISTAIEAAMRQEPTQPGTGLKLDTFAANMMEMLCPGVKNAFTNGLTCMAFTDRKTEIIEEATKFALTLF